MRGESQLLLSVIKQIYNINLLTRQTDLNVHLVPYQAYYQTGAHFNGGFIPDTYLQRLQSCAQHTEASCQSDCFEAFYLFYYSVWLNMFESKTAIESGRS